jgi:hypothetical protein
MALNLDSPFKTHPLNNTASLRTIPDELGAVRREGYIRLAVASVLALATLAGAFAAAWDVQWHAEYGRDTFWSAPHIWIYGALVLNGLIALAFVLYNSFRYNRPGSGVNATNTVTFLRIFHAPLGFYLLGFSILADLPALPLDNYWHELYGIDVTIWAPFHAMAIVSGIFSRISILIILVAEYNRSRLRQKTFDSSEKVFTNLTLLCLAANTVFLLSGALLLANPSIQPLTEVFKLGDWTPAIYPTLLALIIPLTLIGITLGTARIGMATLTAVLFSLFRLILEVAIQPLTDATAPAEGLTKLKRPTDGLINLGILVPDGFPIYTIVYGLLIDLAFMGLIWLWSRRQPQTNKTFSWSSLTLNWGQLDSSGSLIKWLFNPWWLVGVAMGIALISAILDQPYLFLADQTRHAIPILVKMGGPNVALAFKDFVYPELGPTIPLVLITAALAGIIARYFGLIMRYTQK